MENPCKNCMERKFYAKAFDMHFSGEDCPYICEEYERYKEEKMTVHGFERKIQIQSSET